MSSTTATIRFSQSAFLPRAPRAPLGALFCLAVLFFFLLANAPFLWAAEPVRRPATMPVRTSLPPPAPAPAAKPSRQTVQATTKQPAPKGINGFSANPLSVPARDRSAQERPEKKRVYYTNGTARKETRREETKEKLTVTAKNGRAAEGDRLVPQRRAFSGGEHTLSRMGETPSPEVSLDYKMDKKATTRVVVNPQDETSPLYRPAESNSTVNSAGVYMDVDVQPNLTLQVGGEYCEVDSSRAPSGESGSSGASVGLQWHF